MLLPLKSSVARPVMATPTRVSASAKLRTNNQLWLHFLRSSLSRAAATSRLVEMMRQEAMLRITPITRAFTSLWVVDTFEFRLSGVMITGGSVFVCAVKYDMLVTKNPNKIHKAFVWLAWADLSANTIYVLSITAIVHHNTKYDNCS